MYLDFRWIRNFEKITQILCNLTLSSSYYPRFPITTVALFFRLSLSNSRATSSRFSSSRNVYLPRITNIIPFSPHSWSTCSLFDLWNSEFRLHWMPINSMLDDCSANFLIPSTTSKWGMSANTRDSFRNFVICDRRVQLSMSMTSTPISSQFSSSNVLRSAGV